AGHALRDEEAGKALTKGQVGAAEQCRAAHVVAAALIAEFAGSRVAGVEGIELSRTSVDIAAQRRSHSGFAAERATIAIVRTGWPSIGRCVPHSSVAAARLSRLLADAGDAVKTAWTEGVRVVAGIANTAQVRVVACSK